MNKLQILIPIGGLGERFSKAGFETPKPLIDVDGKPMIVRSLESLYQFNIEIDLVLSIRNFEIANLIDIEVRKSGFLPRIVAFNFETRGAIESAFLAQHLFDTKEPLLIMDCDIQFRNTELVRIIEEKNSKYDGYLTVFNSNNAGYSYVETNGKQVVRTREKEVISNKAIAGAYYFKNAKNFFEPALKLLNEPQEANEYYISLIYNELISNGASIGWGEGDFNSFGTPNELKENAKKHLSFTERLNN